MAAATDVTVVTPWFPTYDLPFRGAFVRAMVEATAPGCDRLAVYHCDRWSARMSPDQERRINRAFARLVPHTTATTRTVGGAVLHYVPVAMPRDVKFAETALRHDVALRAALAGKAIESPVVHVHIGFYSGYAAVRNARSDARIFVTEHATFLDQVLEQDESRQMYDELLHRCAGLFAVGEAVRRPLVEAFPHHAWRISITPNPISFDQPRTRPVTELRRWLFLGGLIPRKGVDWLLEAFAQCWAEDSSLRLTLVGDGELSATLRRRASQLGVETAVTFIGGVAPHNALNLMRDHDLLVHPSRMETFGMTIVEAVAAGMPVLVTRCGGPQETLAGIEDAAGEFIDVEESPNAIVAGYWRLRERFPGGLDLDRAQRELAGRYSYQAVAAAHHRAWFSR